MLVVTEMTSVYFCDKSNEHVTYKMHNFILILYYLFQLPFLKQLIMLPSM